MRVPCGPGCTCTYETTIDDAAMMQAESEADAAAGKYVAGHPTGPVWVTALATLGAWHEKTTRVCTAPDMDTVLRHLRDAGFDREWSYGLGPRDGEIRSTLLDGGVVLLSGERLLLSGRSCVARWPETDSTHWDPAPFNDDEEAAVTGLLAKLATREEFFGRIIEGEEPPSFSGGSQE